MKKTIIIIILTVLITARANAQNGENLKIKIQGNEYEIRMDIRNVLSQIILEENVYKDEKGNGKESELKWKAGYRYGLGFGIEIGPEEEKKMGVRIRAGSEWYAPGRSGKVTDRDWQNGIIWSEAVGDLGLLNGYEAEAGVSAVIPLGETVVLEGGCELRYANYGMSMLDGKIEQVEVMGDPWEKREEYKLYGNSITYMQEWVLIRPKVGIKIKFKGAQIWMNAMLQGAGWGNHLDGHYFRKMEEGEGKQKYLYFNDMTDVGKNWGMEIGAGVRVKKNASVELKIRMDEINGARGDTVIRSAGLENVEERERGKAGAGIKKYGIEAAVRVRI